MESQGQGEVQLMGLRAKSKSKSSGTASVTITANGDTHRADEEAFEHPHDTPCSRVSFGVGFRRSENYQSVSIDVRVDVPCTPGTELAAGEFCADKCSQLLQANADDAEGLLRSLG